MMISFFMATLINGHLHAKAKHLIYVSVRKFTIVMTNFLHIT